MRFEKTYCKCDRCGGLVELSHFYHKTDTIEGFGEFCIPCSSKLRQQIIDFYGRENKYSYEPVLKRLGFNRRKEIAEAAEAHWY